MPSSKELFDDLLKDTLTYLAQTHRSDERIFCAHTESVKTTLSPQKKRVEAKPPPLKRAAPLTPPAPPKKEEKKEPPPPLPPQLTKPPKESHSLKKVLLELAPNLFTDEPIPDDAVAQKKRFAWKEKRLATEVTLLSFESHSRAHVFLQNLASAIDVRIRPAKVALTTVIEKENHWDLFFESSSLKHLIAFPIPFDQFPNLRSYYKENPQSRQKFLSTTPLFLLRPFSEYQTQPLLKKTLWNALCTQLSS